MIVCAALSTGAQDVGGYYPVSPAAGSLAKGAGVPVNLSGGQIRYQIPIAEIETAEFTLPVGLGYAYSGLRLEEPESEFGLGWTLSLSGGAIVREIRGLPDEHRRGYWGSDSRRAAVANFNAPGDMPLEVVRDFSSGLYDAAPDRFMINLPGKSFSFFITNVDCPNCLPENQNITVSDLPGTDKVKFNWNSVEVVDGRGIRYLFSEKEWTDFNALHVSNSEQMQRYVSAWYLSEIILNNGQKIRFSYTPLRIASISFSEVYNRTLNRSGELIKINCTSLGGLYNTGQEELMNLCDLDYDRKSYYTHIDAVLLSAVEWADGKIEIKRTPPNDSTELDPGEFKVWPVNRLEVTDPQGAPIRFVDFEYENQARRLLRRVTIDSTEHYRFEYWPVSIRRPVRSWYGGLVDPGQNPFAQDYWGFANGLQNTTAIPELGGKRNPVFEVTRQGALKKIIYPTGGSSEILYEANRVKVTALEYEEQQPYSANKETRLAFVARDGDFKSFSERIVFSKTTYAKIYHRGQLQGPSSMLSVSFGPADSCVGKNPQTYYTYAAQQRQEFPELTPKFHPLFGLILTGDAVTENCGDQIVCESQNTEDWIRIEPGDYLLEGFLFGVEETSFNLDIIFCEPDAGVIQSGYAELEAPGIRVASVADLPFDPGVNGKKKFYRYKLKDGTGSGMLQSRVDVTYDYQVYDAVNCRDQQAATIGGSSATPLYFEWNYPARAHHFKTLNPLVDNNGSPVYYSRVEILDDEKGFYGSEVAEFFDAAVLDSGYPHIPVTKSPLVGLKRRTGIFNGDGMLLNEERNYPIILAGKGLPAGNPSGIVFGKKYEYRYTPLLPESQLKNLLLNGFAYRKYNIDIPVAAINPRTEEWLSVSKPFLQKYFTFDEFQRLKSDSVYSVDGVSTVHRYYYPSATISAHRDLIEKNRIDEPYLIIRQINGTVIDSVQTTFGSAAGINAMAPVYRYRSNGKDKILIQKILRYHHSGKPAEWISEAGIRSFAKWNYSGTRMVARGSQASAEEVLQFVATVEGQSDFTRMLDGLKPGKSFTIRCELFQEGSWIRKDMMAVAGMDGTLPINLKGKIRNIRIHPAEALVEYFTYTNSGLLSTQSDELGKTVYYEYDRAERLSAVRDEHGDLRSVLRYKLRSAY